MLLSSSRPLSFSKAKLLALAATACVIFTAGCGMGGRAPGSQLGPATISISGIAHGGRQAIANATVYAFAAGNTGYGSPAGLLATATTDGTGGFSFSASNPTPNGITCPSGSDPNYSNILYFVIAGGDPGGGTNPASILLSVVGDCSFEETNNNFIFINEITTVAAMTAFQQFFNPTIDGSHTLAAGTGENFGTSATNTQGINDAQSAMYALVSTTNGTPQTTSTRAGLGITMNINSNDPDKIRLAANVLAACVNSTGAGSAACSTLFSGVNSTPAVDTLQAAYYMASNPTDLVGSTSNIATVCGAAVPSSPYSQSTYTCSSTTAVPDWTLGITYSTNGQVGGNYFFNSAEYLAIDSNDNIWVANFGSTTATTNNTVSEMNTGGVPLSNVLTGVMKGPSALAIDPSDDIWVLTRGSSTTPSSFVYEYNTNNSSTSSYAVSTYPSGLAIDGNGDIYTFASAFKSSGNLDEVPYGYTVGTALNLATGIASDFTAMAIDGNDNIWVTGGGAASPGVNGIFPLTSNSNYTATPTATTAGGQTGVEAAIAIDNANNIWGGNYVAAGSGPGNVSAFTGNNLASISGLSGSPYAGGTTTGGFIKATGAIVDGLGNIWMTTPNSTTTGVFEWAGATNSSHTVGTLLSPADTGFLHNYSAATGIAIDAAGDVWVGSTKTSSVSSQGFITEIVGAAAPVINPLAANLPVKIGTVSYIAVTAGGTGYASAPAVVITPAGGDPGTGAAATAIVSGGAVTGILVTAPGSGYQAIPTISFTGTGTGATATATLNAGLVNGVAIDTGGSGYTSEPTITTLGCTPNVTALATISGGVVTGFDQASGGGGGGQPVCYSPAITITGGGGSGATGHLTFQQLTSTLGTRP